MQAWLSCGEIEIRSNFIGPAQSKIYDSNYINYYWAISGARARSWLVGKFCFCKHDFIDVRA